MKALFLPDDDYFSGKLSLMRENIVFIDDIMTVVEMYKNNLGMSKGAPTITVDFGEKYGGEQKILDLSFYAPYKPYGDKILTAFMWGWFIWRQFMSLHVTIRGESSGSGKVIEGLEVK